MSLLTGILALFGSQKAGEHIVKSVAESYEKHRRAFPGRDQHYYLALAYLAYYKAIGANADDPNLQEIAFRETGEHACIPYPGCVRALGIHVLQKSHIEMLMRNERLKKEYAELIRPVREAKKTGSLGTIYKERNPNMAAEWIEKIESDPDGAV